MRTPLRKPFCPVLAGPTAVGKTNLILQLAREFPLEVISLDSRQIYRGLRIGTAQPDPGQQAICRHHLIDILPPEQTWSAQIFRDAFCRLYVDIRDRKRIPLVTGGAGLYLAAIDEGFFRVDPDPETLLCIRRQLDPLADSEIRSRLEQSDPDSHARIHMNDRYRSQRALEILELTGHSMTELRQQRKPDPALGLEFPVVVLDRDRAELRQRISARLDRMLAIGWLEEIRALLEDHPAEAPGLQTLGYRQLITYLRGDIDLQSARSEIILKTGQYAKRQQTWFGAHSRVICGTPDDPEVRDTLRSLLLAFPEATGSQI